jgi:hypothetical protein
MQSAYQKGVDGEKPLSRPFETQMPLMEAGVDQTCSQLSKGVRKAHLQ